MGLTAQNRKAGWYQCPGCAACTFRSVLEHFRNDKHDRASRSNWYRLSDGTNYKADGTRAGLTSDMPAAREALEARLTAEAARDWLERRVS